MSNMRASAKVYWNIPNVRLDAQLFALLASIYSEVNGLMRTRLLRIVVLNQSGERV